MSQHLTRAQTLTEQSKMGGNLRLTSSLQSAQELDVKKRSQILESISLVWKMSKNVPMHGFRVFTQCRCQLCREEFRNLSVELWYFRDNGRLMRCIFHIFQIAERNQRID